MKKLLLVRHAERGEIAPNSVGNDVLLTKKGILDAQSFGRNLRQVISIKSSPIQRCIETAKMIGLSTGYPIDNIQLSRDLGDPGFIISDGSLAWQHWQNRGHHAVNQYLLSGKEVWEGFQKLGDASQIFLNSIIHALKTAHTGTHIWVTHDTILATFASRILSEPLTIEEWPNFLSYLEISLDGEQLEFSYYRK